MSDPEKKEDTDSQKVKVPRRHTSASQPLHPAASSTPSAGTFRHVVSFSCATFSETHKFTSVSGDIPRFLASSRILSDSLLSIG